MEKWLEEAISPLGMRMKQNHVFNLYIQAGWWLMSSSNAANSVACAQQPPIS
jgi:hypothetical protein